MLRQNLLVLSGQGPLRSRLMNTIRHHERRQVAAFKRRRGNSTNPLHKALYVRATVDVIEERRHSAKDKEALLESPSDHHDAGDALLAAIAVDLQPECSESQAAAMSPIARAVGIEPFGSWRSNTSGDRYLERERRAAKRAKNGIVDGALSPASCSTESLLEGTLVLSRHPSSGSVVSRSPTCRATELFRMAAARRQRARPESDYVSTMLMKVLPTVLRNAPTAASAHNLRCLLIRQCAVRSWERALLVARHFMDKVPILEGNSLPHYDVVLWGAIQRSFAHRSAKLPPAADLIALVKGVPTLLQHETAVAPFLAVLRPSHVHDQLDSTWERVLALVTHGPRCCRVPELSGVAAGELLRALYRNAAPLTAVQSTLDALTDPSLKGIARRNMSCYHLYAGYISGAPWLHALEIFTQQAPHYGVPRTPRLVAAVMQAHTAAERPNDARRLFRIFVSDVSGQGRSSYTYTAETCHQVLAVLHLQLVAGERSAQQILTEMVDHIRQLAVAYGIPTDALLVESNEVTVDVVVRWLHMLSKVHDVHPCVISRSLELCRCMRDKGEEMLAPQHAVVSIDHCADPLLRIEAEPMPAQRADDQCALSADALAELLADN